jgi:hypothetical protein
MCYKDSDLAGIDPHTGKLTPLFNPRRHKWMHHFDWNSPLLRSNTRIGRVTVAVLHINDSFRIELREELIGEGLFPPVS